MQALWESTTRTPLSGNHRKLFRERAEVAALAELPRVVVERAARSVHAATGELRLTAWLDAAVLQRRADPPLRIELVPSSCWWSNLRSELPDEQWTVCKRWSAQRAGRRCEVCGDRGPKWPVECHEQWTYLEDERPRVQRLDGLVSLCPACHESTHTGFARTRGRYAEAMRHLVAVNGWDLPRGEASFDACGRV